jgi:hypothetical protein
MKIVINSHNRSDIARNHLLESIKLYDQYKNYEFIIVIGGYYDLSNYEISKDDNFTYIKANHNSIDYTGLVTLLHLYKESSEYYLYLHDTCKIGPQFFNKLSNIDLNNVSSLSLTHYPSMNMGIYSQSIINSNDQLLHHKLNKDSSQVVKYKNDGIYWEDCIFKNDNNTRVINNHSHRIVTGPTDYYKTGTMRIVEYYDNLDLYKIKANWGQGGINLNN